MLGISAASEKYQQVISQVFRDIEGVQSISDDIVVFGRTKEEHDRRLVQDLDRIREKKLILNKDKCEFGMDNITFMGHMLSKNGIGPTSDRVKDLVNAAEPNNASEVKSFLGVSELQCSLHTKFSNNFRTIEKVNKKK